MKFKNGREIKEGDPVSGLDHAGRPVKGTAVAGHKDKGHDELVFQHGIHKTVCPSLHLVNFLHADDVDKPAAPSAPSAPAIAEA